MEYWSPYLIAGLLGLLVGIEREKAHPLGKTMGVRTFVLLALLGALAGGAEEIFFGFAIAIFVLLSIVVAYFISSKEKPDDMGLTTEFAAAVVFVIGYGAHHEPLLSAVLGPVVALVLFSKKTLHRFTATIRPSELQAAILLMLLAVSVLRLLPDRAVDPWSILNPKKFGLLVLVLAGLEFTGYVFSKIFGAKKGSLISGFLGGFASSTAVLLSTARKSTQLPKESSALLSSAVAAKAAALIELLIIVAMVSPPLLMRVAMPVSASLIVAVGALLLMGRKAPRASTPMDLHSPLDFSGVVRLSVFLAVILALVAAVQKSLGTGATQLAAFFTGLFELHGMSLAIATMFDQGQMPLEAAGDSILIGVVASLTAKIGMAWVITRSSYSRRLTVVFLLMALAAVIALGKA
ncbi:MAG: MgtC/SapB family protein [Bdellovibrionales bacterium]